MRAALALVAVATAACHGKTTVVPAIECADPCCGGQPTIDCAETPNVSCVEDADPCSAHVFGCADGSYYFTYPDVPPSSCIDESGAGTGGLVLGDGSVPTLPDADAAGHD